MKSPTFTKEDFFRMYHPSYMPLIQAYLDEEQLLVKDLYHQYPKLKRSYCIEIGGGNGMNIDMMKKIGCKHLAVDPLPKENLPIECIEDIFENLSLDLLPPKPHIYFFHFNVAAYIQDLSTHLNRLIQEDDWFFFSQWANTDKIKKTYSEYFHFFTQERLMGTFDPHSQRVPTEKIYSTCLEFNDMRKGKLCELLLAKSSLLSLTC